MSLDHKRSVAEHYNSHANTNVTSHEAQQRRRQGASLPLKQFHNGIKLLLIKRFTVRGGTLLDLCCGRGGDLNKWNEAEVAFVRGVDISEGEVAEAGKRLRELQERMQDRKKEMRMKAQFEVNENLGDAEFLAANGPFDTVTCMFALHYFYETEAKLRMFLRNVSRNLKPGGHFVCTMPDGKRILWHLQGNDTFQSQFLRLSKMWQDLEHEVQPFGHKYLWALDDTVTAGAGSSEGSVEFLSFFTPLMRIAAHYGMTPVIEYDDPQLVKCFEEEDTEQPCKHFRPTFTTPDNSLEAASSTFVAIVFRKLNVGEELPLQRPPLLEQLVDPLPAEKQPEVEDQTRASQPENEPVEELEDDPPSEDSGGAAVEGPEAGQDQDPSHHRQVHRASVKRALSESADPETQHNTTAVESLENHQ